MKAVVIYDSKSGNTQKVAKAIYDTVAQAMPTRLIKVDKESEVDLLAYDLIFMGSPVIDWLPTKTMMNFVRKTMKDYNGQGMIEPSSPIRPGKFFISFATFAGPHIGVREARPMTMWLNSALEHIGYITLDSWHVVGQFATMVHLNSGGRLGDIENRPHEGDLQDIINKTAGVIASLRAFQ